MRRLVALSVLLVAFGLPSRPASAAPPSPPSCTVTAPSNPDILDIIGMGLTPDHFYWLIILTPWGMAESGGFTSDSTGRIESNSDYVWVNSGTYTTEFDASMTAYHPTKIVASCSVTVP